ncbi:nad metabolism atpase/kinase-like protein [Nitritalea halalkaliphila LW7]|uniref:Nad metabolism atpase/kinase-like protein n=1 Tax=Nitritalea halalkaliphila LW7 TaxID=1189621 RepID=I5CAE3_9BACT|nr:ATP-binding protein [Nitritalea halalkaliphila]EIM78795.1 nad metabolism atpase/kinase-like protein [Nitritalea halalkaliphila LW7]
MFSVAIVGTESSGKSTLARALQAALGGHYVPEFARSYLAGQQPPYLRETLWEIAKGQLAAEAAARASQPPYLWCDTSMLTMKIWEEHAFGAVAPLSQQPMPSILMPCMCYQIIVCPGSRIPARVPES